MLGLVVSELTFYPYDPGSNPAEANSFFSESYLNRDKIYEKRPWLAHLKMITYNSVAFYLREQYFIHLSYYLNHPTKSCLKT